MISEELRARIESWADELAEAAPPLSEDAVRELRALIHPRVPRPADDDDRP